MRNAILALLRSLPIVSTVAAIDFPGEAQLCRTDPEPDVLLLHVDRRDEALIRQIGGMRARFPSAPAIVLVDTAALQQAATDAGANAVLLTALLDRQMLVSALNPLIPLLD